MLYKSISQTRRAAMTTVNHRHERIGEEIAHEINAMLAGELKDPRLEMSVVVNQVLVAHDMRHARVLVGVRGTQAEQKGALKALEHASNYIRHEILERLQLRRVPDLHFSLDNSQEYTERIDQLLKELKKDSPSTT
jgi:ribosome-binding factor A